MAVLIYLKTQNIWNALQSTLNACDLAYNSYIHSILNKQHFCFVFVFKYFIFIFITAGGSAQVEIWPFF